MNAQTAVLDGTSRTPELTVALVAALFTTLGALGASYFASQSSKPPEPQKPQYELWSPSSLNPKTQVLIVFKIDKTSGTAWQLQEVSDSTGKHPAWTLITNPDHK